jgi:hypothetical protein
VRLGELERDIAVYISAKHPPGRAATSAEVPPFDDLWRNVKARDPTGRDDGGGAILRIETCRSVRLAGGSSGSTSAPSGKAVKSDCKSSGIGGHGRNDDQGPN